MIVVDFLMSVAQTVACFVLPKGGGDPRIPNQWRRRFRSLHALWLRQQWRNRIFGGGRFTGHRDVDGDAARL